MYEKHSTTCYYIKKATIINKMCKTLCKCNKGNPTYT